MNLSSIQSNETQRPLATSPARPRPSAPDPSVARPGDEQAIADGLSTLDGALEAGDLGSARKALARIRTGAGLQGEAAAGEADPLSAVSSALGSDDLGAARKAWGELRSSLEDDDPVDYSVTVTRTATFSILA